MVMIYENNGDTVHIKNVISERTVTKKQCDRIHIHEEHEWGMRGQFYFCEGLHG